MSIKKLTLTHWIFIGVFLGIIAGKFFGESIIPTAQLLSDVFLRLLKMAIVPLILTSIIAAVVGVGHVGRLGVKTFGYYMLSSLMAILTGQILVNIFRPGVGADIGLMEAPETIAATEKGIVGLLVEIIPENPFYAMAQGDVLPVIFFSILFGYFITKLDAKPKTLLSDIFKAAFDAMLKMTLVIIWTAPLGVFGIIAVIVAQAGFSAFSSLGYYFLVVVMGLGFHWLVNLPLLLTLIGRVNPIKHYKGMVEALLVGFTTCSTMATLPLTMKAVTERSKVSKNVAGFTLPIGATVNMDGTALYECVAAVFIAQLYGFELGFGAQAIIVLTALLASIGAAGIPMAGLIMLSIVLRAVGLPLEGVGIILAVDRFLDMFRTATNILSDSCGAVIIARTEGETLEGIGEWDDEPDTE